MEMYGDRLPREPGHRTLYLTRTLTLTLPFTPIPKPIPNPTPVTSPAVQLGDQVLRRAHRADRQEQGRARLGQRHRPHADPVLLQDP